MRIEPGTGQGGIRHDLNTPQAGSIIEFDESAHLRVAPRSHPALHRDVGQRGRRGEKSADVRRRHGKEGRRGAAPCNDRQLGELQEGQNSRMIRSAMSTIQKFFLAVFPAKWAQSMEAESRAWIVKCPSCGHERSVWEL